MFSRLAVSLFVASSLAACGSSKGNSPNPSAAGGGGEGGTEFTVAALAKTWISNCETGTEPITGDDHYQVKLVLGASGSFQSQMIWSSGNCSPVNVHVYYTAYGTYTLSDIPNSTAKTMNFTIDFVTKGNPDMMLVGNATRTSFNSDCGGTSPYNGGANATDGSHQDTVNLNCMHETFPNSILRKTFKNIATYDNGNFYIGVAADQNIAGAFDANDVAGSATVYMH